MNYARILSFSVIALSGALSVTASNACTEFRLKADDNTIMVARTFEFAQDASSNVRTSPEGRVFQMIGPDGKNGLTWTAKYGYVFADAFGQDIATDGLNEVGLSVGELYLPGYTKYPTVLPGNDSKALPYLYFVDWILGNFKTVDEVKNALSTVNICVTPVPIVGMDPKSEFPLHFSVYDRSGKGIVIEFVDGKTIVHDNTVGVLTNSPTYDWQVTNLSNYINLSPYTPKPFVSGSLIFMSGQGGGMKGLPGDVTPPSRFVKIALMKETTYPAKNATDELNIAQHIMNNVDIPAGTVRATVNGKTVDETTQWTVFKDLTHDIFYYHSYKDTTIHEIDLSQLDFSPKAKRLKMPMSDNQFMINETQRFKSS